MKINYAGRTWLITYEQQNDFNLDVWLTTPDRTTEIALDDIPEENVRLRVLSMVDKHIMESRDEEREYTYEGFGE